MGVLGPGTLSRVSRLPSRTWQFTRRTAVALLAAVLLMPIGLLLAQRVHPLLGLAVFGAAGVSARLVLNSGWDATANHGQLVPIRDDFDGMGAALACLRVWPGAYYGLVLLLFALVIASLGTGS